MKEQQDTYPVATMGRAFRVSPSGFYAWRDRKPSRRARRGAGILGYQYTALAFGARCQQLGVRPSRGTVGDVYDNAMAES